MYTILISDKVHPACEEVFRTDQDFEVDIRPGLKVEELKAVIGKYDGLIARSSTKVTAAVIEVADRLKVIGRTGVGVDNIDIEAATEKRVLVMNTPDVNTIATAEHTLALLLALARKIPQADSSVKKGEWRRDIFRGIELWGKTLGLIGLGRVGREVAVRANAFGMVVAAYDPYVPREEIGEVKVDLIDLNDLLTRADFISLHVPLNTETRGMIGESQLSMCRDGVRIINCARGGVIDEKALLSALQAGKVAGAALDVFEQEPPQDDDLLNLNTIIITPHVGGQTQEATERAARSIAKQVIDYLKHGAIRNGVNAP
jgi:D-3-phosphoglycerate dehydrogenase